MARHKPLPHTAAAAPAPTPPPNDPPLVLTGDASLINESNQMFFITGSGALTLLNSTNDTLTVAGDNVTLCPSFGNLPNVDTIQDLAQGLTLNLSLGGQYTVTGFQNDLLGSVVLNKQLAAPVLAPDGHGGTMATLNGPGAGSFADFVGDPHMTVAGGPGAWKIA